VIVTVRNVIEAFIPVTFTDNQKNPPDFPFYPISLCGQCTPNFSGKKILDAKNFKKFFQIKKKF